MSARSKMAQNTADMKIFGAEIQKISIKMVLEEEEEVANDNAVDISWTCRTCGDEITRNGSICIMQGMQPTLRNWICRNLNFKLNQEKGFPVRMCLKCFSTVNTWVNFTNHCKLVQRRLEEIIRDIHSSESTINSRPNSPYADPLFQLYPNHSEEEDYGNQSAPPTSNVPKENTDLAIEKSDQREKPMNIEVNKESSMAMDEMASNRSKDLESNKKRQRSNFKQSYSKTGQCPKTEEHNLKRLGVESTSDFPPTKKRTIKTRKSQEEVIVLPTMPTKLKQKVDLESNTEVESKPGTSLATIDTKHFSSLKSENLQTEGKNRSSRKGYSLTPDSDGSDSDYSASIDEVESSTYEISSFSDNSNNSFSDTSSDSNSISSDSSVLQPSTKRSRSRRQKHSVYSGDSSTTESTQQQKPLKKLRQKKSVPLIESSESDSERNLSISHRSNLPPLKLDKTETSWSPSQDQINSILKKQCFVVLHRLSSFQLETVSFPLSSSGVIECVPSAKSVSVFNCIPQTTNEVSEFFQSTVNESECVPPAESVNVPIVSKDQLTENSAAILKTTSDCPNKFSNSAFKNEKNSGMNISSKTPNESKSTERNSNPELIDLNSSDSIDEEQDSSYYFSGRIDDSDGIPILQEISNLASKKVVEPLSARRINILNPQEINERANVQSEKPSIFLNKQGPSDKTSEISINVASHGTSIGNVQGQTRPKGSTIVVTQQNLSNIQQVSVSNNSSTLPTLLQSKPRGYIVIRNSQANPNVSPQVQQSPIIYSLQPQAFSVQPQLQLTTSQAGQQIVTQGQALYQQWNPSASQIMHQQPVNQPQQSVFVSSPQIISKQGLSGTPIFQPSILSQSPAIHQLLKKQTVFHQGKNLPQPSPVNRLPTIYPKTNQIPVSTPKPNTLEGSDNFQNQTTSNNKNNSLSAAPVRNFVVSVNPQGNYVVNEALSELSSTSNVATAPPEKLTKQPATSLISKATVEDNALPLKTTNTVCQNQGDNSSHGASEISRHAGNILPGITKNPIELHPEPVRNNANSRKPGPASKTNYHNSSVDLPDKNAKNNEVPQHQTRSESPLGIPTQKPSSESFLNKKSAGEQNLKKSLADKSIISKVVQSKSKDNNNSNIKPKSVLKTCSNTSRRSVPDQNSKSQHVPSSVSDGRKSKKSHSKPDSASKSECRKSSQSVSDAANLQRIHSNTNSPPHRRPGPASKTNYQKDSSGCRSTENASESKSCQDEQTCHEHIPVHATRLPPQDCQRLSVKSSSNSLVDNCRVSSSPWSVSMSLLEEASQPKTSTPDSETLKKSVECQLNASQKSNESSSNVPKNVSSEKTTLKSLKTVSRRPSLKMNQTLSKQQVLKNTSASKSSIISRAWNEPMPPSRADSLSVRPNIFRSIAKEHTIINLPKPSLISSTSLSSTLECQASGPSDPMEVEGQPESSETTQRTLLDTVKPQCSYSQAESTLENYTGSVKHIHMHKVNGPEDLHKITAESLAVLGLTLESEASPMPQIDSSATNLSFSSSLTSTSDTFTSLHSQPSPIRNQSLAMQTVPDVNRTSLHSKTSTDVLTRTSHTVSNAQTPPCFSGSLNIMNKTSDVPQCSASSYFSPVTPVSTDVSCPNSSHKSFNQSTNITTSANTVGPQHEELLSPITCSPILPLSAERTVTSNKFSSASNITKEGRLDKSSISPNVNQSLTSNVLISNENNVKVSTQSNLSALSTTLEPEISGRNTTLSTHTNQNPLKTSLQLSTSASYNPNVVNHISSSILPYTSQNRSLNRAETQSISSRLNLNPPIISANLIQSQGLPSQTSQNCYAYPDVSIPAQCLTTNNRSSYLQQMNNCVQESTFSSRMMYTNSVNVEMQQTIVQRTQEVRAAYSPSATNSPLNYTLPNALVPYSVSSPCFFNPAPLLSNSAQRPSIPLPPPYSSSHHYVRNTTPSNYKAPNANIQPFFSKHSLSQSNLLPSYPYQYLPNSNQTLPHTNRPPLFSNQLLSHSNLNSAYSNISNQPPPYINKPPSNSSFSNQPSNRSSQCPANSNNLLPRSNQPLPNSSQPLSFSNQSSHSNQSPLYSNQNLPHSSQSLSNQTFPHSSQPVSQHNQLLSSSNQLSLFSNQSLLPSNISPYHSNQTSTLALPNQEIHHFNPSLNYFNRPSSNQTFTRPNQEIPHSVPSLYSSNPPPSSCNPPPKNHSSTVSVNPSSINPNNTLTTYSNSIVIPRHRNQRSISYSNQINPLCFSLKQPTQASAVCQISQSAAALIQQQDQQTLHQTSALEEDQPSFANVTASKNLMPTVSQNLSDVDKNTSDYTNDFSNPQNLTLETITSHTNQTKESNYSPDGPFPIPQNLSSSGSQDMLSSSFLNQPNPESSISQNLGFPNPNCNTSQGSPNASSSNTLNSTAIVSKFGVTAPQSSVNKPVQEKRKNFLNYLQTVINQVSNAQNTPQAQTVVSTSPCQTQVTAAISPSPLISTSTSSIFEPFQSITSEIDSAMPNEPQLMDHTLSLTHNMPESLAPLSNLITEDSNVGSQKKSVSEMNLLVLPATKEDKQSTLPNEQLFKTYASTSIGLKRNILKPFKTQDHLINVPNLTLETVTTAECEKANIPEKTTNVPLAEIPCPNITDSIDKLKDTSHLETESFAEVEFTVEIININCPHCSEVFTLYEEYTNHLSKHGMDLDIVNTKCPHCTEIFTQNEEYVNHLICKHNLEQIPEQYSSQFVKNSVLEVSTNIIGKENEIPLESAANKENKDQAFLSKTLNEDVALNSEIGHKNRRVRKVCFDNTINRAKFLVCDFCHKTCAQKKILESHILLHLGVRPFQCNYCYKSYTQHCTLKEHERTHIGEKVYACKICNQRFDTKSDLKIHKFAHATNSFKCDNCSVTFSNPKCLSIQKHHVQEGKRVVKFLCQICRKQSNKHRNKIHLRETHHTLGGNIFNCPKEQCTYVFSTKAQLTKHVYHHKREESNKMLKERLKNCNHPCAYCDRDFEVEADLRVHSDAVHAKDYPYACGFCTTRFKKNSAYISHVKTHSENGLFSCSFQKCLGRFHSLPLLDEHLEKYHNTKKTSSNIEGSNACKTVAVSSLACDGIEDSGIILCKPHTLTTCVVCNEQVPQSELSSHPCFRG